MDEAQRDVPGEETLAVLRSERGERVELGQELDRGGILLRPVALLFLSPAPSADAAPDGIHVRTLENGLRVLTLERHAAPVVSCQIWYGVGSADELPGRTGLAHFLEHLMHGWFLIAFEVVMITLFLVHMAAAVTVAVTVGSPAAR